MKLLDVYLYIIPIRDMAAGGIFDLEAWDNLPGEVKTRIVRKDKKRTVTRPPYGDPVFVGISTLMLGYGLYSGWRFASWMRGRWGQRQKLI